MKLFTLVRLSHEAAEGESRGMYYSHRLEDFTNPFERDLFTAESKHLVDTSKVKLSPGAYLEWREVADKPSNYYSIVHAADRIVLRKKPYIFLQYAGDDEWPRRYTTVSAAIDTYRKTARELAQYGQAIEASLHYALLRSEIAEYPDRTLSYDMERGTVRTART